MWEGCCQKLNWENKMYVRANCKIFMKGDLINGVPQIFKPLIIGKICNFITCTLFWVCTLHPLMTLFEHVEHFTNDNDSGKLWSFKMFAMTVKVGSNILYCQLEKVNAFVSMC